MTPPFTAELLVNIEPEMTVRVSLYPPVRTEPSATENILEKEQLEIKSMDPSSASIRETELCSMLLNSELISTTLVVNSVFCLLVDWIKIYPFLIFLNFESETVRLLCN